jgi:hypothetical protein
MKCTNVLIGMQTTEGKRSFFVIEPYDLDEVFMAFGEYRVEAEDMRHLRYWAEGKEKPQLLLVSVDLKSAALREKEDKGGPVLLKGESLLPLYKWPVEGGVEKFHAVLERDIGPYPVECKRYGLKGKRSPKLKVRTNPRYFAEFDPVFFAQVQEDLSSVLTIRLVWHAILGRAVDNDGGKTYTAIMKELGHRFELGEDFQEPEPYPNFYDTRGFSLAEVESRQHRAASFARLVNNLYETYLETNDLEALELRISENVKNLDLALEVYVVLLWESHPKRQDVGADTREFREVIQSILWGIICKLT